jgi:hypothetical protein
MLPVCQAHGGLYGDLKAATAAAKAYASRKADIIGAASVQHPDDPMQVENSDGGQTGLGRWT